MVVAVGTEVILDDLRNIVGDLGCAFGSGNVGVMGIGDGSGVGGVGGFGGVLGRRDVGRAVRGLVGRLTR